ncbi:alpha/beta hydrolase [Actinorhabdospora filicis]|uniref:Alpha/beta hydrolase n=1 Tax=Actinorhabdospora filicis TaxID=1785913 RepID=A0A9W6WBN2_9ACTN|nr:alpha/beta hydrolase [Actinorhabdospora filicis]GLZ80794.1 alpha/beta hydrolase [Actinorhabdospora filicis]
MAGLWVEDTGGDGTPVVFLHAGWGDSASWEPVLELLPDDVRTIRYDQPGYGRSPAPGGDYSNVGDLRAVLDERGVDRAVLVGHSGGGGIALSLAVLDPARVAALVLVAPGVPGYPWDWQDPFFRDFGAAYLAGDVETIVAVGHEAWGKAGPCAAVDDQFHSAARAFLAQKGAQSTDPPVYDRLGEIGVPAVVAVGDLEHHLAEGSSAAIAERVPHCRYVPVPGADHMLPLRAPEVVSDLVMEALASE